MFSLSSPLHDLRVAAPCKATWEQMEGDDRVRFCDDCALNVYNLSAMTAPEAEQLIMQKEGRLCVRFYQREDGTVLTRDCPRGLIAMRRAARRTSLAIGAAIGAMFLLLFSLLSAAVAMGGRGGNGPSKPFNVINKWLNGASSGGTSTMGMPAPVVGTPCPVNNQNPPPGGPDESEPRR